MVIMSTTYILRQWESLWDFVTDTDKKADPKSASHTGREGWAGPKWSDAIRMAKFGGYDCNPDRESFDIDIMLPSLRRYQAPELDRIWDVVGDAVDVGAYLNGDPECMYGWIPNENQVEKRALCLILGHSIISTTSVNDLLRRGEAIIGLVEALAVLGFELEIWSECSCGGSKANEMYSTLVRLHAAGEPLDVSALQFALGSPAWLRRIIFGANEGENDTIRKRYGFGQGTKGGYGRPTQVQHAKLVNADLTIEYDQMHVSGYGGSGYSWVWKQLEALGLLPDGEQEPDWKEEQ